jgi:uncharacterized protein
VIVIISPAKRLDFKSENKFTKHTLPRYLDKSSSLIEELLKIAPEEIAVLMNTSRDIANLTVERYSQWKTPFNIENARQALLAFNGDVYRSMEPGSFSDDDMDFAQDHLRIISGLYGVLRPFDLIQPYRLEMGTGLSTSQSRNLYEFWSFTITMSLNEDLRRQKEKVLVNLASREYFMAVDTGKIEGDLITPVFKEYRGDKYKIVGINAKKARGLMGRFIIRNRLEKAQDIKLFNEEGYSYDDNLSSGGEWIFTR